ncbi:MAG: class B sortase [Oscillospiraceae bacterium]|nr:class B sortase [Oscillospiraceae bacterium]
MENKNKMPSKASEIIIKSDTKQKSFFGSFRKVSVTAALTIGIILFSSIALFTAMAVMAHNGGLRASREEYEALRERSNSADGSESGNGEFYGMQWSAFDLEMRAVNPDYVFWIRIDGTGISYPVVRGEDNEKYLSTSFGGETNPAGALFMDFRNDLTSPHILLYGHNLLEGGMFTELRRFLDDEFLENNRYITIMVYGEEITFEIFTARLSDIDDPAYDIDLFTPRLFSRFANRIGAPLRASQIITLSTCTRGGSDDERVIVQGYRVW